MTATTSAPLRSTIPARLDRLSWSPFHTRMVAGLGAAEDSGSVAPEGGGVRG